MTFTNEWPTPITDPRDTLSRDELLTKHLVIKEQLEKLKAEELDLRKYIVKRAFPDAKEGMNTQELGNGYQLKAGVKFNYNLVNDNDKIFLVQDKISKVGNKGAFIAERLFSWKCNFLLTEYRVLQEDAKANSPDAIEILKLLTEVLTIDDKAAPTLDIKEPKGKNKK